MKKIKKIVNVIERFFIKKIYYFNAGIYRKLYVNYLIKLGVKINGKPNFISNTVYFDGADYSLIEIGNKATLSSNVMLLTHDRSPMVGYRAKGEAIMGCKYDSIHIGNNSFIGARSILLQGTHIGENTIVGAGAVVKGKFPDNVIITGNPAKVVGNTLEWHEKKSKDSEELSKIVFGK